MKFGVREICDVVFRATKNGKIGDKFFYEGEPVIYFDSLKTSTLEGAATTVYAQGGRGNARLVAWEGERTVTFTMEDALISPLGLAILTGAGIVKASGTNKIQVHTTATVAIGSQDLENGYATVDTSDAKKVTEVYVTEEPTTNAKGEIYLMPLKKGKILSEPIIGAYDAATGKIKYDADGAVIEKDATGKTVAKTLYKITVATTNSSATYTFDSSDLEEVPDAVLVDFYVEHSQGAQEITIDSKNFAGTYYVEASTLFRDEDGVDYPAEFIIPKAKIQSNFTFTMASSGDPSTFTFTLDAFPGYTKFDPTEEVFFRIQVIDETETNNDLYRVATNRS